MEGGGGRDLEGRKLKGGSWAGERKWGAKWKELDGSQCHGAVGPGGSLTKGARPRRTPREGGK